MGQGCKDRGHQAAVRQLQRAGYSVTPVRRTAAKIAVTFLPCQPRGAMSAIWGGPADICSMRVLRILTPRRSLAIDGITSNSCCTSRSVGEVRHEDRAFKSSSAGVWLCAAIPTAQAAPCLIVTLTGSGGGPPTFNGLAGPGTLVRYGDDGNNCNAVKMQFDAGRGTNMRLSQIGVPPDQLNAMFFTHMHTDHTEGFADILQLRWHFHSTGPKIDVVCSSDVASPLGFTISCRKFVLHIADAFIQSGEIAQRLSEVKERLRRRTSRLDQRHHLRAEERAPGRLVVR